MTRKISPRDAIKAMNPKFIDLTDTVLFGDVWERPALSKRDRSLITVAVLTALYRPDALEPHLLRAITNGLTTEEINELFTHVAFYAGWPSAFSAATLAARLFAPVAGAEESPES